jgi:hypothetical protein
MTEQEWEIIKQGSRAWDIQCEKNIKIENPYEKGSDYWLLWNRGYNTNFNGI